jgi:hypothetical protein
MDAMSLLPLLLQALAGVVGANAVGMLRPRRSLGGRVNTALGAIAGVAGGSLLGGVLGGGTPFMMAAAALAGAVFPAVVGAFRRAPQPTPSDVPARADPAPPSPG